MSKSPTSVKTPAADNLIELCCTTQTIHSSVLKNFQSD